MTDSLVYVYSVLPQPVDSEILGIDGAVVRWIHGDGVAAAVSDVPAEQFDQEPLNANVRDLGWLGPRAVAHQDVNARLFEVSDAVVPLAFGTVFHDASRVRRFLLDDSARLRAQLERVRGCAEWVVALHQLRAANPDDVAAASATIQKLQGEIAASSPGRAHLLNQQLVTLQRDESRRLQSEAAADLLDRLRAVSVDAYREPLPTDAIEKPLLRASVLVPRSHEQDFLAEVESARRRWPEPTYRLLLTGPWPAYRFGGLAQSYG